MRRSFAFCVMCTLSLSLSFATDSALSFTTTSFGRRAEARVIEGTLHWSFPADGLALGGEGKVDWKGISISDISTISRISLSDGSDGIAVAGIDETGQYALYLLKDVWGGLELAEPTPAFIADIQERIVSVACYRNEEDSSFVTAVGTDRRLVACTRYDYETRTDEYAILPNIDSRIVILPDSMPSSQDLLVFAALCSEAGWAASLWTLSDGALLSLGTQAPVPSDMEPSSFVFSQSGSDRSMLMLSGSVALQWSWFGNVPIGGALIPLGTEPDTYIWHGAGKKALFLSKSEEGFSGTVTAQSGFISAIPWRVDMPGPIAYSSRIMRKGEGFRLWCITTDDDASVVYSVEISPSGETSAFPYGTLDGGVSGASIAWSDGSWVLSTENGRILRLNDSEKLLEPLMDDRHLYSITQVEGD